VSHQQPEHGREQEGEDWKSTRPASTQRPIGCRNVRDENGVGDGEQDQQANSERGHDHTRARECSVPFPYTHIQHRRE
jgi:hypothetical protein